MLRLNASLSSRRLGLVVVGIWNTGPLRRDFIPLVPKVMLRLCQGLPVYFAGRMNELSVEVCGQGFEADPNFDS